MAEPIDEYYRDLVNDSEYSDSEPRIFKKYGQDDLAYRRAAFNLLTTGSESANHHPAVQEAHARIQATNDFHENPVQIQEGVIDCPRCGSNETLYFEKQSRSADEPATIYCRCKKCNKAWREN